MTALDAQVRLSGPVYQQAWVAHMNDNGLMSPHTMMLDGERLRLSLHEADAPKWVESVTPIEETVTAVINGIERVALDAYLPLLNIRVQLRFPRRIEPSTRDHLRAVTA